MRKNKVLSSEEVIENIVNKNPKNPKKDLKQKYRIFKLKLEENFVLTERQNILSNIIQDNKITFIQGVAGTGKSATVCYTLLKLLFEGKIEKIIFTKPLKESGENLGFIPGDINDKIAPYVESFLSICTDLISADYLKFLTENNIIECRPLAYMRGITFKNAGLFLDEIQNCTPKQIILYITRFGKDSKMIIAGDVSQTDINQKENYIISFLEIFSNINGIQYFKFTKEDIMREPLLIEITDAYEKWKVLQEKE